ncbi:MAG: hypothetical protein PHT02_10160 [Tissierellia bacterium]|nr:hypothetical protein [Tissierellia bacterium]
MAIYDIRAKWYAENAPVNATYSIFATEFGVTNAELVFTGKLKTADYDGWAINLVDPKADSKALSVAVDEDGKEINVSLATSAVGAITSTAKNVKEAIEAHPVASSIIDVAYAEDNTGAGIVTELEAILDNGADGTVCQDTNVVVQYGNQLYINILPNSRHDANWRKLNLVDY